MTEFNAATKWYPPSVGEGRMGDWLENNVDWAVSRDRYWGTPLPVWVCDQPNCRKEVAIGSVADLQRRAGRLPEPLDLHRPFVDDLTWPCDTTGCDGILRRTPEVVDCWFDSGSMPYAQWHYPFENRDRVERETPADFICEGVDQTRGWFYTLLAVSAMYRDRPAYRACVSNDMVLDAKGKKMAKSRGNIVDPVALLAKHGADVVRWYLLTSRPVWLPLRFDEADIVEVRNRLFGTLLNTYHFFATYANADGHDGAAAPPAWRPASVIDRWLLSRLHGLVAGVGADLESWETSKAGKRIAEFVVEDLSNWYVRRNRRRIWKGALTDDKRDAYRTLHATLLTVSRLLAPFAPFLSDALHRALLPCKAGALGASVHLADWPRSTEFPRDEALEARMEDLRSAVSLGHAARQKAGVKVRQPLARLSVVLHGPDGERASRAFLAEVGRPILLEELNVKAVEFLEPTDERFAHLRYRVVLRKKAAAPRYGARYADVERWAAGLDLSSGDVATGAWKASSPHGSPQDDEYDVVASDEGACHRAFARNLLVEVDGTVTPDLRAEGLVREFGHALQALRKQKGFQVTDRVHLRWSAGGAIAAAIRAHARYVADEILATSMEEVAGLSGDDVVELETEGEKVLVALDVVRE